MLTPRNAKSPTADKQANQKLFRKRAKTQKDKTKTHRSVSALFVNKDKDKHKKYSKSGASNKGKEYQEGENIVVPKKARVVWEGPLQNLFLEAIEHISLEKATAMKILKFMKVPGLTRRNVESHLQGYRRWVDKNGKKQQMITSLPEYRGSVSALNSTNFGSTGFSTPGASTSNSVSQLGLLGTQHASFHQSPFGSPLYQANQATYCTGSNNNGRDLLSRGGMSHGFMKEKNSKQMFQQKSQTWSDLYNNNNNNNIGASLHNNFGTSGWKPSFSGGNENMGTSNNHYSAYAGKLVGIGQKIHNANAINGGYVLLNGTGHEDVTAALMGDAAFGYLPQGEPSSSAFGNANYQFPPAFTAANEEANPSVPSPLSQQQYGHIYNGQNDFAFGDLLNNASVVGNIAHRTDQFGEGTNIHDLLLGRTDQVPYQLQEINLDEDPSLRSNALNPSLRSNAIPLDDYYRNSDQNPNQKQGDENYGISS